MNVITIFKNVKFDNTTHKINLSGPGDWILMGLEVQDINSYKKMEDEILQKNDFRLFFNKTLCERKSLKFLRLAGPKNFRLEVMKSGTVKNNSIELLSDPYIKEIEFIFVNPFSASFLQRMDAENKENHEIWRIKDDVLRLASRLLFYGNEKEVNNTGTIKVGFHIQPLIFNLGIVGDDIVVARAYLKGHTGHDASIPNFKCSLQDENKIAEGFINYYNFIKNDIGTKFVSYPYKFENLGKWPSLFKANATIKQDDTENIFEKKCYQGFDAESLWITEPIERKFFKPVRAVHLPQENSVFIEFIDGITCDEFLYYLQEFGKSEKELSSKLNFLLKEIICQSFHALMEYQEEGLNSSVNLHCHPYPWELKLSDALSEAGRYLTNDEELINRCNADFPGLCAHFKDKLIMPFRDAHIKNRMITIEKERRLKVNGDFFECLQSHDEAYIAQWLNKNTRDIDFETGLWKVTVWDDPLHIFCFQNLGVPHEELLRNVFKFVKNQYKNKEFLKSINLEDHFSEEMMWTTLLCRSFREYCRRVWYKHVMPETYDRRYRFEISQQFLDLSKSALNHLDHDNYPGITELLKKCRHFDKKHIQLDERGRKENTVRLKIPFDESFKNNHETPQGNSIKKKSW